MKFETYQRLSWKTFYVTLLQNSVPAITIAFIWIIILFIKTLNIESATMFEKSPDLILLTGGILDFVIVIGFVAILFSFILILIGTLIKHLTFHFMLSGNGIGIKRGLIHINETIIPYRHIENTEIDRPFIYRVFGMCKLHILTGAKDQNSDHKHTLEIEFPTIDLLLAEDIKKK